MYTCLYLSQSLQVPLVARLEIIQLDLNLMQEVQVLSRLMQEWHHILTRPPQLPGLLEESFCLFQCRLRGVQFDDNFIPCVPVNNFQAVCTALIPTKQKLMLYSKRGAFKAVTRMVRQS